MFATIEAKWLTNAVGPDLDIIGALVGQPRTVLDDPTYRAAIRLRIQANMSQGRSDDLVRMGLLISQKLTGDANGLVAYLESGIMSFTLTVTDQSYPVLAASLLEETRAATSRGAMVYSTWTAGDDFSFTSSRMTATWSGRTGLARFTLATGVGGLLLGALAGIMSTGIGKLITWAVESLFPAGANPWNAQPCKVAPGSDLFTPNTKPPAEYFNYLLNALAAQDQALQNQAVSSAVANFDQCIPASVPIGGGGSWDFITWHPYRQTWFGWVHTSTPNVQAYSSRDNGKTWATELVGISATNTSAVWMDPASINWVIFTNLSGTAFFYNEAGTVTLVSGL